MSHRIFPTLLVACLVLAAACSDPASSSGPPATSTLASTAATATSTPASTTPLATATPTFVLDPDHPSGDRILELVRALSVTIGPRPAGTDSELAAAQYIASLLRSFGYDVELQKFAIGSELARQSALAIITPEENTIPSVPLANSGSGSANGVLVAAGIGTVAEIPPQAQDAVLLIERGDLFFQEKVANAQAAGAIGVIIYNNEPGAFLGSLQTASAIPAVSISQDEGQTLINQLGDGPVEVEVSVEVLSDAVSYNVVAKPPGGECETISGGHYDSVIQAAGASDNASGTAVVIEIAAVLAGNDSMHNNCFVLFGAEELGLLGSRAFVDSLTPAQFESLQIMFNFDMVGVGSDGWLLIGGVEEQQWALEIAEAQGLSAVRGQLPTSTSSDHASFISAGIPAVMFHRTTDNLLHTPQDTIERVQANLLEEAARLGLALLASLSEGS